MESNTRQVSRVPCWHHNVVILESIEACNENERWAFKHQVVMFTPKAEPDKLELADENEGTWYVRN